MTISLDPLLDAPTEIREFFAGASALRRPDLRICPLSEEESRKYTSALRRSEVGEELGLIALDDADDSNPYCYIIDPATK